MKVFYLFFLFLILGCSSSKEVSDSDIVGKYSYKGIYGVSSGIEFKEDKTFTYTWVTGLLNGTTEGTWSVSGKKIILNSDRKKSDVIKFKILESFDNNSAFYKLKFLDENKDILPNVNCILLKDNYEIKGLEANFDGELQISKNEDFQKIKFLFTGFQEFEINKEDLKGNATLMMMQKETYYQYFENEVMILKGDKIYTDLIKNSKQVKNIFFTKID
ncbi:MAG: hypothetical protein RBT46_08970 [Weeksellaceae bacterium]|jgi:hypothetical protein|nr:hypothetical protein [Weeksellaceae bacterium]